MCTNPATWRYNKNVCRCDGCRQKHTDYQRHYEQTLRDRPSMRAEDVKLRRLAEDPTDWMAAGDCHHPAIPNDLFFAPDHAGPSYYGPARHICYACPVRLECLAYAFRHRIEYGYWGGMNPQERKIETKRRRRNAA